MSVLVKEENYEQEPLCLSELFAQIPDDFELVPDLDFDFITDKTVSGLSCSSSKPNKINLDTESNEIPELEVSQISRSFSGNPYASSLVQSLFQDDFSGNEIHSVSSDKTQEANTSVYKDYMHQEMQAINYLKDSTGLESFDPLPCWQVISKGDHVKLNQPAEIYSKTDVPHSGIIPSSRSITYSTSVGSNGVNLVNAASQIHAVNVPEVFVVTLGERLLPINISANLPSSQNYVQSPLVSEDVAYKTENDVISTNDESVVDCHQSSPYGHESSLTFSQAIRQLSDIPESKPQVNSSPAGELASQELQLIAGFWTPVKGCACKFVPFAQLGDSSNKHEGKRKLNNVSTEFPMLYGNKKGRRKISACPYPDCHWKFSTKTHLNRHLKKHTGERPFRCAVCQWTCARLDNLRQHEKKHNKT